MALAFFISKQFWAQSIPQLIVAITWLASYQELHVLELAMYMITWQ